MATPNRDAAASLGLPAAVEHHPGWGKNLINVKNPRSKGIQQNANRGANGGFRVGRRARGIGG